MATLYPRKEWQEGSRMQPPKEVESITARFREGPALLEDTLAGISETDLDAVPSQGGWTIRQIVHHVADGDDLWKTCIKVALGNERTEFSLAWYQAFPQEHWTEAWGYSRRSIDTSLALLRANRAHIQQLLEQVPNAWTRSVDFRRFDGEMMRVPVGFVVEMQTNHLVNHVNRIRAILHERGGV